jgi:hypothetical protein
LRQDKHQDMRQKRQKLTSESWLRLVCGGFHNHSFQLCSFLCVMSQTSRLDCYMSWRMPVCGLPNIYSYTLIHHHRRLHHHHWQTALLGPVCFLRRVCHTWIDYSMN